MAQTPAIFPKFAAGTAAMPAGKLSKNAKEPFACVLDEAQAAGTGAVHAGQAGAQEVVSAACRDCTPAEGAPTKIRPPITPQQTQLKDAPLLAHFNLSALAPAGMQTAVRKAITKSQDASAAKNAKSEVSVQAQPLPGSQYFGLATIGEQRPNVSALHLQQEESPQTSSRTKSSLEAASGNLPYVPAASEKEPIQQRPALQSGNAEARISPEGSADPGAATDVLQEALPFAKGVYTSGENIPVESSLSDGDAPGVIILGRQTHFSPTTPSAKLSEALNFGNAGYTANSDGSAGKPATNLAGKPAFPAEQGGAAKAADGTQTPLERPLTQVAPAATGLVAAAPGQPAASPMQQVMDAIEAAIPPGSASPQANQMDSSAPDAKAAVKSLTIALDPQGLGTVSIELSLKNNGLGLRLGASDANTAQLLKQNDEALTKALGNAGYTVTSLSVHVSTPSLVGDPPPQAGVNGQGGFSAYTSAGGGGGGAGSGTEAQGGQGNKRDDRKENGYGRPGRATRDPALYV